MAAILKFIQRTKITGNIGYTTSKTVQVLRGLRLRTQITFLRAEISLPPRPHQELRHWTPLGGVITCPLSCPLFS